MKKCEKYNCYYISGGGTEHNAGMWEKTETDKTIVFKYIGDLHFEPNYTLIKVNKFYSKKKIRKDNNYSAYRELDGYGAWFNNGHVIRVWHDGTYTIYPQQCGTPYIFTPLAYKQDKLL